MLKKTKLTIPYKRSNCSYENKIKKRAYEIYREKGGRYSYRRFLSLIHAFRMAVYVLLEYGFLVQIYKFGVGYKIGRGVKKRRIFADKPRLYFISDDRLIRGKKRNKITMKNGQSIELLDDYLLNNPFIGKFKEIYPYEKIK